MQQNELPDGNRVGRITTAGQITEFRLPHPGSFPSAISTGPDGHVWFTELDGNRIGRITPEGSITEFAVPTPDSGPRGLAVGHDNQLVVCRAGWQSDRAFGGAKGYP